MASAAFWSWHNLGQIRLRQVRVAEGARALRHALGIIEQVAWKHWPDQYASCLHGLGGAAAFQGDGRRAARLMGAAEAILAVEHHFLQPADAADRDWNLSRARALLDEADWQAAWAEGQALTLEQAVAEGLGLAEDLAAEAVGGQGMEEGRLG